MESIDVAELRKKRKDATQDYEWGYLEPKTEPLSDAECDYLCELHNAAPALLDELERLRKIAERLPDRCCITCAYDCGRESKLNACDDWLPLDGEKEE